MESPIPVDALLGVLDDIHRGTSIIKMSLDLFNNMLTEKYEVNKYTVEQLRDIKGTANLRTSSLDKTNEKLKYYQAVKVHLEKAERMRPIEEQFPFVRTDMIEFDRQLNKLFTSNAYVENRLNNESDQMEIAVQKLFRGHLQREEWDFAEVLLPGGIINGKKNVPLVQWDDLIYASRGDESRLFLIETKIYPHANDIICDEEDKIKYSKCLYVRGVRTIAYLASLLTKNIEGQCAAMRVEDKALLELIGAKIELVYSSRIMNKEIKERIGKLSTKLLSEGCSVNVSYMECPSASEGKVTSVPTDVTVTSVANSDLPFVEQDPEQSEADKI